MCLTHGDGGLWWPGRTWVTTWMIGVGGGAAAVDRDSGCLDEAEAPEGHVPRAPGAELPILGVTPAPARRRTKTAL
jgi:hypothetical protein